MIRPLSCAILFVIACAAAPDQTAPNVADLAYGPLPDSVLGSAGWTKVLRPAPPLHCGAVLAWGCYTHPARKLEVVSGLSPYHAWWVLEHEKVHMIQSDANLQHIGTAPQRDSLADAVATVRMLERLQRRCP